MLALSNPLAARELLDARDVDAVDARAIVGQQRRQRPTDHFGAVHHADRPAEQAVAVRQDRVVDVQVFEDLDHGERRAREDALDQLLIIQKPDVLVHVEDVLVAETLDVLGHRDDLLQVLVLAVVEDRVVHDDAVDGVVHVAGHDGLFDVVFGD